MSDSEDSEATMLGPEDEVVMLETPDEGRSEQGDSAQELSFEIPLTWFKDPNELKEDEVQLSLCP